MSCQCYTFNDMCTQCRSRYSLLVRDAPAAKFKRHPGEVYERPNGTYPVVFTAQYRTANPQREGRVIPRQALQRLSARLEVRVGVYADIRIYVPRTSGEQSILWLSILIDFPGKVQIDQDLLDLIFKDLGPSDVCWDVDNPADPDTLYSDPPDDLCLFRLEWFMRRLTKLPSGRI
ncbi:hypothetical protein BJX70DRAFT_373433 [Aspergillus crustosus]